MSNSPAGRSATTRPSFMTTTRSLTSSTSERMWLMNTAAPPSPTKRRVWARSSAARVELSEEVGSSRMTRRAASPLPASRNAMAISTIWRSAMERSAGRAPASMPWPGNIRSSVAPTRSAARRRHPGPRDAGKQDAHVLRDRQVRAERQLLEDAAQPRARARRRPPRPSPARHRCATPRRRPRPRRSARRPMSICPRRYGRRGRRIRPAGRRNRRRPAPAPRRTPWPPRSRR